MIDLSRATLRLIFHHETSHALFHQEADALDLSSRHHADAGFTGLPVDS